uniref:Putative secreted protein n=1 Tax=Anopheles triannulatus TaxID=58253 RepID=A0A2M4B7F6_9DIPT
MLACFFTLSLFLSLSVLIHNISIITSSQKVVHTGNIRAHLGPRGCQEQSQHTHTAHTRQNRWIGVS